MDVGEDGTKDDAVCIDNASNAREISDDVVIIKRCLCWYIVVYYFLFFWPSVIVT